VSGPAADDDDAVSVPEIPIVNTWGDLLKQDAIAIGGGTRIRLGMETNSMEPVAQLRWKNKQQEFVLTNLKNGVALLFVMSLRPIIYRAFTAQAS
jgi:hypothetical protein